MEHHNNFSAIRGFIYAYAMAFTGYSLHEISEVLQIVVLIIGTVSGLIGIYNGLNKKK